jgi:hypothetical protein
MTYYRERLWPAPWLYIATALVIPATLLVFVPINFEVGIIVAAVFYLGSIGMLVAASPVIAVTSTELIAGKAKLPISLIGATEGFSGDEGRLERGQRLDARAWLLIRGWIDPVVRITLTDPNDPTPYWLISTRHPDRISEALAQSRAG